jgi:predicted metal-dependent hydrolase
MKIKSLFLIVILLVIIYLIYVYFYDATVYFTDITHEKIYKVRDTYYKEISARKLATIDCKLTALINAMRHIKHDNPNVETLIKRWDSGISIKEIGNMETDAAYVINKKHMAFCLHNNPDPNLNTEHTLEDDNLLGYAAIHELAHIMSEETGHGSEFIKNFKYLLNYAKIVRYYDRYHNSELPIYIELSKVNNKSSYCSINIQNTIE